ncbi:hypothetical protein Oter_3963 [Opitutus terrae PB90-1]|uniref:Uncharacterized protein n=2 Tax=Opitutus terrae TaxID=107709 RepID=B1ZZQ1_OPITP|nr:hypothetical protein Oter_3963 [Opitutus terrae PB90-1]
MAKRIKKNSKSARSLLKLEALEQRQLLAGGFTDAQGQQWQDIVHSNGNVYDQVLLKSSSITVDADPGQVTRVSFLDQQGDIVQAEFSGAGTLTIALDPDTYHGPAAAVNYNQPDVMYVQGLASFTITGSDASTNFSVFSVGKGNASNQALFDDTHTGGDHWANVARLTIVASPSNPNGSLFGGIRAGDAIFSAENGVVGITASNVQVQSVVRIGDIDAKGTATPALVFGEQSQFVSVDIAGGDLVQTNAKAINNSGSYGFSLSAIDNVDSSGAPVMASTITNTSVQFSDKSPFPAPKSYDLTTAIDTIVGSTADDVINGSHTATSLVVSALDKIDGAAGNDVLNISDSNGGTAQLSGLTVKNVETFMYTSTGTLGSANAVDMTGWTGLTSANLTLQNIAANTATVTATKDTAVVLSSSTTVTPGLVKVVGGSTVTVTNAAGSANFPATATEVDGVNGTSSVSITQTTSGTQGAVLVKDYAIGGDKAKAGTISTVTVNGATDVTVNSNALATLTLTKVSGTVLLTDELAGHATSGSGTTLALNLNDSAVTNLNQTTATVKEVDFTTSGKKSSIGAWGTAGEVATITVAGDQALDLGNISGLGKLATLTSTATAGVTATVDATKVTVTGGAGNDVITLSGQVKKASDLGAGDDWVSATLNATDHKTMDSGTLAGGDGTDTLALTGQDAVAASTGTGLAAQISGFEKLEITGSNFGTVDMHNLDDINQVILSGDFGGAYAIDKLASGASLTIKAGQTGNGTITVPVSAVQTESLAVTITSDTADINAQTLATGNINTINLNVVDTNDTKNADDTVNFTQAKVVNITGNVLSLTSNTGAAGTVDASGMAGGKLILTTTAGDGSTIKGTTKGSNDITATGAGKITITTGNSADTIAVAAGTTITAGDGANVITASGAGNSITTGKNGDSITVTATSGTTTISAGDGNDTITVAGQAVSNITLGGGADKVVLSSKAGSAGYFTTISGAGDADILDLSAVDTGTATFNATAVTLGQGATFSDYVASATAGNVAGNAVVSWFNFGGDTYIVVDNGNGTYDPAGDVVVRLTGALDLSAAGTNAGIAAGVLTI